LNDYGLNELKMCWWRWGWTKIGGSACWISI